MIEPTESESLAELNNFVDVMLAIWQEIQEVKNGEADKADNVLTNAPHPEYEVVADTWEHSYTRQKAGISDRKRTRQQVLGECGACRQHTGRP